MAPEIDSPLDFILASPEKIHGTLVDIIMENGRAYKFINELGTSELVRNMLTDEANNEAARYVEAIRKMTIVLLDSLADRHGFTFDHA